MKENLNGRNMLPPLLRYEWIDLRIVGLSES
jgi:hypothetical protein